MSKTKNWLMDMEENFWTEANKVIGECETCGEYVAKMFKSKNVSAVLALSNNADLTEELEYSWDEFWSQYK